MRKDLQLLKLITVLGLALFCSILAIAQPNEWTKYEDNPVLSSPLWGEGAFYCGRNVSQNCARSFR